MNSTRPPTHSTSTQPTHCNTLQHTATHCNTVQHTASHCNTLQHTATHCNTLINPESRQSGDEQHLTFDTYTVDNVHVRTCQHICAHVRLPKEWAGWGWGWGGERGGGGGDLCISVSMTVLFLKCVYVCACGCV